MNQGQYKMESPPQTTQTGKCGTSDCRQPVPSYMGKAAIGLGVAQIVLGVTLIVLQVCASISNTKFGNFSAGYWTGPLCIATGINGILSGKYKTRKQIKIFMGMSIACAILAAALTMIMGLSVLFNNLTGGSCRYNDCVKNMDRDAISAAMAIFGFIEMVVAIISSGFGCAGICCTQQQVSPNGQVVVIANVQGSAGGYQPQMGTAPPPYDTQEKKSGDIP